MKLQSLGPLLLTLTSLLFSPPLFAASPTFWIEPALPQDLKSRFSEIWRDCLTLARLAAITFQADCRLDPTFERYFETDSALFVKHIFYTLANIPLDATLTEATAVQTLQGGSLLGLSPKFWKLTIAFGEPPWLPKDGICADDDGFGAYASFRRETGEATIVLCLGVLYYPTLDEILRPRPWAYDEQGRLREGYTCDGLLDRDNAYMEIVAGWLLHELIHWEELYKDDVPEWDQFVSSLTGIKDFDSPGATPEYGYGAFNARLLKERAVSHPGENGHYPTVNNADSYMWYALSNYWSWRCQRPYRGAQTPADEYLRMDQGVGYNGENIGVTARLGFDQPSPGSVDYDTDETDDEGDRGTKSDSKQLAQDGEGNEGESKRLAQAEERNKASLK
ncbi:hypothetical protein A1O7_07304 [Cladophialophora yegresii CBS 114405]|uniref:Lysine-specific metallo-endopeptidase domain-containing protein n=1 Tax=Cladophialophora yegresii CBS 114405 TaxID=1182544 RepID=W9VW98_9EURO|nr:uncharacterized protein A1O7_07304 [Cladophialophora yegresii CBS 114405]EXJ56960.1 hypothetical protein A1O7_07304 [Cladophialophora yegresii CBS 114405]